MTHSVWVSSCQQQCCGKNFGIGSSVEWNVRRVTEPDSWIDLLLGAEWATKVGYAEDHHLAEANGVIAGVVRRIQVVTCTRELGLAELLGRMEQCLVAVRGSGRLRDVAVAEKWEPEPRDEDADWTFEGWIVELEPL